MTTKHPTTQGASKSAQQGGGRGRNANRKRRRRRTLGQSQPQNGHAKTGPSNGHRQTVTQLAPDEQHESTSNEPEAFAKLGLGPHALAAVRRIRFETPTEIQEKFIPAALTGKDCIGQARTGTGKTVAFLLPIFEKNHQTGSDRALVLAPTRELADQIYEESGKLSGANRPLATAVYGGRPIKAQIDILKKNPEIVVATPGRLLDHAQRRTIDLGAFSIVVLDEVDRMFDMGFRKDITRILGKCTRREQTLFLSATLPSDIMRLAERFLRHPHRVSAIDESGPSVETLDQRYFSVMENRKVSLLVEVLQREKPGLGLIFTRTKRGTERLGKELKRRGYNVMHIHGDLTQGRRRTALRRFKEREIQLLVATDVMGRGIDVQGVSHVINYDIPENPKDYLHRVGRSGRMNAPGTALTFVTPSQGDELTEIEFLCNCLLEKDFISGFDNGIRRR